MTQIAAPTGGPIRRDAGTAINCCAQLRDPPRTVRAPLEAPSVEAGRGVSIAVEHLAKHYGEVRAVDDVSFTAHEGEIFGFLGHNGAGKTTTIRVLTGRARPTSGRASVVGHDVVRERERMKPLINLVFEDQNLYPRLSGRENLQLFAELYGAPRSRIDDLLEAVGLVGAARRKVKTYSSGMKQRLMVARALVNKPRVLFLDEPTRGLDPTSAREVRAMVREQARQGTTVFLTTHYMEEADELCDRVAFLASGHIVALDTPRELKLRYGERSRRRAARLAPGGAGAPRRPRRCRAPRALDGRGQGPHRALAGGDSRGRLRQPGRKAAMSWARIRAIYRKDMRDALRDSRVLTALLMPLLLGLLYSVMLPDENVRTQKVKVGVVSESTTELTTAISQQAPRTIRLTFVTLPSAALLERQVQQKKVDVGLLLPPGFDAAVKDGASPTLTVVLPSSPSFDRDYVGTLLDRSVQALAGQAPSARVVQRSLPPVSGGSTALDVLGQRRTFILVSIILVLAMIAVYAVPAVLIEETEKKTMDALTLIASTADVIAAKALFGIALSVVAVPVLMVITRGHAAEVAVLAAVVVLSAVVLVGLGLLFAGLLKNQQQVNTWSGLILVPLLAPAFAVGLPTPDAVNKALWLVPTGHTFRLIANAFAGRTLYPYESLSLGILLAWGVGAYGFLWWQMSRREDG